MPVFSPIITGLNLRLTKLTLKAVHVLFRGKSNVFKFIRALLHQPKLMGEVLDDARATLAAKGGALETDRPEPRLAAATFQAQDIAGRDRVGVPEIEFDIFESEPRDDPKAGSWYWLPKPSVQIVAMAR